MSVWFTNGLVSIPLFANFPLESDFFSGQLDAPCHNHGRSSRLLASADREGAIDTRLRNGNYHVSGDESGFLPETELVADIRSILEHLEMRKLLLAAAAAGLGLLVSGVSAQAALESFEVSFTASDFTSAFGEPVPTDPVTGSFIITFDPTQTYTDQTVGITLKSLNIGLGTALAFDYSPTDNGNGAADELVVGGLEDGACCIYLGPTSADMYLHILTFTSTPTFEQLGYRLTSSGTDTNYFYTDSGNGGMGSVMVTSIPVPEASTWAMMLVGFAGLGFLAYRKHTAPAAA